MDLIKPVEYIAFESVLFQETKPFLDQYGGSLNFESVGKGDYQVTITLSNTKTQERVVVKNMPSEIAKTYFAYRVHGMIAKLLGELHSL